jgi:ADP-dependent NAD(P)H-hydrate dehydratase
MAAFESITELPRLPPRPRDGHKGTFGHVLVVAGSRGMSGAAILCGTAALRGGAGTAQVSVPADIQPVVATSQPCVTTAGLPDTPAGQFAAHSLPELLELVKRADSLAIGPGLGPGAAVASVVRGLLDRTSIPVVLDADGLNALAPLEKGELIRPDKPTVLTPHPGEFARLVGKETAEILRERETHALRFASEQRLVLVFKGSNTLVTDGRRLYVNRNGNPGMATGGSGDVLTGLVAALLGQKLEPFAAAQLGVYLHGLAGDLARDELGEEGLMATDLLHWLPRAFVKYRSN